MDKQRMIVEGFFFADENVSQKAIKEAESVQYVKGRVDMRNPRMVLEMYRKLVAENVFETPVGLLYLKELQDYLLERPEIAEEDLEPIQVLSTFGVTAPAGGGSDGEESLEWYEEHLAEQVQKRRVADTRRVRAERKLKDVRGRLYISLACISFFVILVVGMIVITMLDKHPNIINYENKIVDKYVEWQQELEEREQAVKEKERELNLR